MHLIRGSWFKPYSFRSPKHSGIGFLFLQLHFQIRNNLLQSNFKQTGNTPFTTFPIDVSPKRRIKSLRHLTLSQTKIKSFLFQFFWFHTELLYPLSIKFNKKKETKPCKKGPSPRYTQQFTTLTNPKRQAFYAFFFPLSPLPVWSLCSTRMITAAGKQVNKHRFPVRSEQGFGRTASGFHGRPPARPRKALVTARRNTGAEARIRKEQTVYCRAVSHAVTSLGCVLQFAFAEKQNRGQYGPSARE